MGGGGRLVASVSSWLKTVSKATRERWPRRSKYTGRSGSPPGSRLSRGVSTTSRLGSPPPSRPEPTSTGPPKSILKPKRTNPRVTFVQPDGSKMPSSKSDQPSRGDSTRPGRSRQESQWYRPKGFFERPRRSTRDSRYRSTCNSDYRSQRSQNRSTRNSGYTMEDLVTISRADFESMLSLLLTAESVIQEYQGHQRSTHPSSHGGSSGHHHATIGHGCHSCLPSSNCPPPTYFQQTGHLVSHGPFSNNFGPPNGCHPVSHPNLSYQHWQTSNISRG